MIPLKELDHQIGDVLFHVTDGDKPGVVTAIVYRGHPNVTYEVTWQGNICELHQACELTKERPKFSSSEPGEKFPA